MNKIEIKYDQSEYTREEFLNLTNEKKQLSRKISIRARFVMSITGMKRAY